MKKLKYIFLLAGALSLASCESWLDEDPQYTINTKTQFSTVENARQALMGCYGYMSADNAYGQAWQEVTFGYCGFGWSQTNMTRIGRPVFSLTYLALAIRFSSAQVGSP